jgi:hypothetical protein
MPSQAIFCKNTCNRIAKTFYICRPIKMEIKFNWDAFGIATSLACAIHCAILPLIVGSLPLFGINIIHNVIFEWFMIVLSFCIGGYALFHGFFKHHHSKMPVILFLGGFLLLVLKQFFHHAEYWLLVPAVILIVWAHYNNYLLCHKSKCSSPHHKH